MTPTSATRMICIRLLTVLTLATTAPSALAQSHGTHAARHNMVLLGDQQIFASHVVYKAPHNYQVILELKLPPDVLMALGEARRIYSSDHLYLVLDPMDISSIQEVDKISGNIFREGSDGTRVMIAAGVTLLRADYKILYFDEVPLSLEGVSPPVHPSGG